MSNNFDALRSGSIGPLSFLCRPKVMPAEVQGIWTLNDTLEDISPNHRNLSNSVTYEDGYFAGTKSAKLNASALGFSLSDFTLDFLVYRSSADWYYTDIAIGDYDLYTDSSGGKFFRLRENSNSKYQGTICNTFIHIAFVRSGSTLCFYVNGNRVYTGSTGTTAINSFTLSCYGRNDRFSNIRLLSKALTTGLTFPTPSGLYTGYEPLNGGG